MILLYIQIKSNFELIYKYFLKKYGKNSNLSFLSESTHLVYSIQYFYCFYYFSIIDVVLCECPDGKVEITVQRNTYNDVSCFMKFVYIFEGSDESSTQVFSQT